MNFKKICLKLHLILGVLSGIIVFVVCVTGCLYAFKDEVTDMTQRWKLVEEQNDRMWKPEDVLQISNRCVKNDHPFAITYGQKTDAISVDYLLEDDFVTVYVNPYSGEILQVVSKKNGFDFFDFVLKGHRYLWLPPSIGKTVVGTGVLCFVIVLVTGFVLWWPVRWTRSSLKRNFVLRLKGNTFLRNFSLHNVLGGYAGLILLVVSLTGLVWSFEWFSEVSYYISSGGEKLKPYVLPVSQCKSPRIEVGNLNELYVRLKREYPDAATFYMALPQQEYGVIRVSVEHQKRSYYKTDNLFFDPVSLEPLEGSGPYAGEYRKASFPDKIRRMNIELHDGRIAGLPGRLLVFLCALAGASLPVTGCVLWLKKRNNTNQKLRKLRS